MRKKNRDKTRAKKGGKQMAIKKPNQKRNKREKVIKR
jgi:hypothetical protein